MVKKLTPQQWKELEDSITEWSPARLKVDGHDITIQLERYKNMQLCYSVYVDGYIRGEWSDKASEIGQKFWRPMMMALVSAKSVKSMERVFGKKKAKEMGYTTDKKLIGYTPHYLSFKALKQVLIKCKSIEIEGK
jgi:hypothetical protein